MSDSGPFGDSGFGDGEFGNIPFFAEILRMLQGQGSVNWDTARQLAVSIANEGSSEPNVDPLRRLHVEQLARAAELHVADLVGSSFSSTGRPIHVVPVSRTTWVQHSLDAYRTLFEKLAGSLAASGPDPADADPFLAPLVGALTPMLMSFTAGSLVGHLGQRSLGVYDLPVPRPGSDDIDLVVPNVDAFGADWSLPADDLVLWLCLHELLHHAVLGSTPMGERITSLLHEHAAGFRPDPGALQDRLGRLQIASPSDLAGLQDLLSDPDMILGAVGSPTDSVAGRNLAASVAVVVGWVDHQMDKVGQRLIGSYAQITEAQRRRRVEASPADRFVERILGLELSQSQYDRGAAFIAGVVERAGDHALEGLFLEGQLPTPSEVDAPGLWLARIDLSPS